MSKKFNGNYRRRIRKIKKKSIFFEQVLVTRQIYLGNGDSIPKRGMYRRESFMSYKGDIIIKGIVYKKITVSDFFDKIDDYNDNINGKSHIHSHIDIKRRMRRIGKYFIWFDKNGKKRMVCWNNNRRPHFKCMKKIKNGCKRESSIQENDIEETSFPLDDVNDHLYNKLKFLIK